MRVDSLEQSTDFRYIRNMIRESSPRNDQIYTPVNNENLAPNHDLLENSDL